MTRTRKHPYTGSRAFDPACRNHAGCPACEGNRLHQDRRARQAADEQIAEVEAEARTSIEDAA